MYRQPPAWTSLNANLIAPAGRADIVADVLDDESILYDPQTEQTHRFNETAFAVWQMCDGHTTTRQIAQHLAEEYEVDARRALDHVEQLLTLFADGNLLEVETTV